MDNPFYLEFSGWIELNPNTNLQYIGEDDTQKPIITVQEYANLPKELQAKYIVEDIVAAMRDAGNLEFTDTNIVQD